MKRFICHVLLFLLPVAAVLAGWEMFMRKFPHVLQYKKDVILEKCRKDGEIVFLGSSHTFFGVNTDLIPHAYNLSYAAQKLHQDLFIFQLLMSKPNHLKYAAVSISIHSFFRSRNIEEWRDRDYVRYWGYPADKFSDRFFILENIPLQLVNVRKKWKDLKEEGFCESFNITPTGWSTSYQEAHNYKDFEKLGAFSAKRHCNVDLNDTREFDALASLVKLARKNNITVILYTTPGYKTYYSKLDPVQIKKMHSMIAGLTAQKGVYYLDLLRSDAFDMKDFFDPDHLSCSGAKKLTLILRDFYKDK